MKAIDTFRNYVIIQSYADELYALILHRVYGIAKFDTLLTYYELLFSCNPPAIMNGFLRYGCCSVLD